MDIEIGRTYLMRIEVGREALTFTGKIISIKNGWFDFIDKEGETLHYNLKYLITYKEVRK